MLESLKRLLEHSPMFALFAVIGIGYALGQVSVFGFSLGVGAVLFAGLAFGALAPKSAPPGLVSSIGLSMFLYGIGIQYGREFFAGLRGAGLRWNILATAGVLTALAVTLALGKAAGVSSIIQWGCSQAPSPIPPRCRLPSMHPAAVLPPSVIPPRILSA